jgi:hypothetical protein
MKKLLIAVLAVGLMVSGAWATVIDHFTNPLAPPAVLFGGVYTVVIPALNTDPTTVSQGPGLAVLGGYRDVTVTQTVTSPNENVSVKIIPLGAEHQLSVANDPNVNSKVTLVYDGGGAMDVALDGDQVTLDVLSHDLGLTCNMTFTDTSANTASVLTPIPGTGAISFSIPFTSFAGVDFNHIALAKFEFTGTTNSVDFVIDSLGTSTSVPEPASLLLLGVAGLPFIRKLRRA